jgi:P27 family predicted phage terminase small subunit
MGTRGPKPTPTAILKARGSWRANRPGEPQPERKAPACPSYLSKPEKAVWKQMVRELTAIGVLTVLDRNPLARYCVVFVRWRTACDFLAKYGTTQPIKDGNGKVKCFQSFPQVAQVNQWEAALHKLEQEFGIGPASRARIVVPERATETPDEERYFGETG